MADDIYEVFALRYAHLERRSSENFIGGDSHDVPMPMDFFVWAVRNESRTIVVDTGFDAAAAERRQREILLPVEEGLRSIGIDHAAVQDVILTHLHYDHAGNTHLFPSARFHVQDCEMAYASGRCMCHQMMRAVYEVDDVVAMVRRIFAGRVEFYDHETEFAPGITLHRIGGHSAGLQAVRVKTARGYVVLASDASHYYAHFEQGRAFPVIHDLSELLEGYKTLKRLATSPRHIVPGHDPLVLARYPAAKGVTAGIAVRLDIEPSA